MFLLVHVLLIHDQQVVVIYEIMSVLRYVTLRYVLCAWDVHFCFVCRKYSIFQTASSSELFHLNLIFGVISYRWMDGWIDEEKSSEMLRNKRKKNILLER